MSFREKSAWVTLNTLIAVLILFWLHIPPTEMLAPESNGWVLHVLLLMITTFIVVEIVAHIVSPLDRRATRGPRKTNASD